MMTLEDILTVCRSVLALRSHDVMVCTNAQWQIIRRLIPEVDQGGIVPLVGIPVYVEPDAASAKAKAIELGNSGRKVMLLEDDG